MGAVVSKKGIKPSDKFLCDECGDVIIGTRVLDGEMVYHVNKPDMSNPHNNKYRCADCQDDIWANFKV